MLNRYQQGCVDVVQLDDRLTVEEIDSVRASLESVFQGRLPQVVMDMRRVRLIDSAGLELIFDSHEKCLHRGGAIRIAAASPMLRDIFRITGIDNELALHPDVVSAAGAFAL